MTRSCWSWSRSRSASCSRNNDFPGDDIPFITGSALKALEGDEKYKEKIIELAAALDTYISGARSASSTKPFLCRSKDVFSITPPWQRWPPARVEQGIVNTG